MKIDIINAMETKEKFTKAFELHQANKLDEAEKLYLKVIEDNSQNFDANNLLGLLYFQKNDYKNAEIYIKNALLIKNDPYFCDNLGKVYTKSKKFDKAIEILKQGLEQDSRNYSLWFDLAMAYKGNYQFKEAKQAYEKVLEINPKIHQAYFNLAYLCFNDNEPDKAIKCYEKALETLPNDFESMYFLSLAYMQTKDYEKGLKYFESRLCRLSSILSQQKTYPNLAKEENIWNGEDISNKTIYTYYEAGFGDVIMFARYLPLLQKRCKKVVFKPQDQLIDLFKPNFPDIEYIKYFEQEKDMHFDIHLPMLSLPLVMGLKGEDLFVGHQGYLKSDKNKAEWFKQKYFDNKKFKIGIKWQGNTHYDTDRVINVESFFPLMDLDNTQFYSCQTFDGSEEFTKIKDKYDIIDLAPEFKDFSYTAAAIENMDLVICNDTSLAHIAGAMGKPCWIVLPRVYNWRWHTNLSKSDWYDSVKLFRQKHAGNWNEVFEVIKNELKKEISKVE